MDHALARQVGRQVPPGGLEPWGLPRLGDDRRAGQALGLVDLQCLDGQFELTRRVPSFSDEVPEPCPLQPASSPRSFSIRVLA